MSQSPTVPLPACALCKLADSCQPESFLISVKYSTPSASQREESSTLKLHRVSARKRMDGFAKIANREM